MTAARIIIWHRCPIAAEPVVTTLAVRSRHDLSRRDLQGLCAQHARRLQGVTYSYVTVLTPGDSHETVQ